MILAGGAGRRRERLEREEAGRDGINYKEGSGRESGGKWQEDGEGGSGRALVVQRIHLRRCGAGVPVIKHIITIGRWPPPV